MDISTDKMRHEQSYEARGIVCKFNIKGYIGVESVRKPFYEFISLDKGNGVFQPTRFKGVAPKTKDGYLDVSRLSVGEIVVSPGLLYENCAWNDQFLSRHLKCLKTYRPKDILVQERVQGSPIDLGTVASSVEQ